MTFENRSTKILRSQRAVVTAEASNSDRDPTARPCHGRSASLRSYRLWMRCDRRWQPGHQADASRGSARALTRGMQRVSITHVEHRRGFCRPSCFVDDIPTENRVVGWLRGQGQASPAGRPAQGTSSQRSTRWSCCKSSGTRMNVNADECHDRFRRRKGLAVGRSPDE